MAAEVPWNKEAASGSLELPRELSITTEGVLPAGLLNTFIISTINSINLQLVILKTEVKIHKTHLNNFTSFYHHLCPLLLSMVSGKWKRREGGAAVPCLGTSCKGSCFQGHAMSVSVYKETLQVARV